MDKKQWKEYERLHAVYEKAREDYHATQTRLRGAFSELARHFDKASLDENRLYDEEKAHERFVAARDELHNFLKKALKD
ncbi:MAG: hypothetical protein AB7P23_11850 [Amphiplicatus sp.]